MKPFGEAPKAPAPRQESFEATDPKRGEKRRLRDAATSPTARYLAMAAIALSTQGCAAFKQAARKALPVITLEGGRPGMADIKFMNGDPKESPLEMPPSSVLPQDDHVGHNGQTEGISQIGNLALGVELKSLPRKPGDREWWRKGEGLYMPPPQRKAFEARLEGFRAALDAVKSEGSDIDLSHDWVLPNIPRRVLLTFKEDEYRPRESVAYLHPHPGEMMRAFAERGYATLSPALMPEDGVTLQWHAETSMQQDQAGQMAMAANAERADRGLSSGLRPEGWSKPGIKGKPVKPETAKEKKRRDSDRMSAILAAGLQTVSEDFAVRLAPSTDTVRPSAGSLESEFWQNAFTLPDGSVGVADQQAVAIKRTALPVLLRDEQAEHEWQDYRKKVTKAGSDPDQERIDVSIVGPHLALYELERERAIDKAKREAIAVLFPALTAKFGRGNIRFHVQLNPDQTELAVIAVEDLPPVQLDPGKPTRPQFLF